MIVCPVCEHQQAQGTECEVCGKRFAAAVARDLPPERVPGLEVTRLEDAAAAASVSAAPLPELEMTRLPSGPDLPPAQVPELERAAQPVGEVPVQQLGDLEQHRLAQNPAERTALPTGPITCRYCRNVQPQGAVCDKCGMRLSRYVPSADKAAVAAPRRRDAPVVLHSCGVRTPAGDRCTSCGAFVPLPE